MTRPFLLTGSHGQVGTELLPLLRSLGPVLSPTRAELDLTDPAAIRTFVQAMEPGWIVNPAAYTAVDKAESEPEFAYAVNRDAPRVLGEEAARCGAAVIHFSTDYVFPGTGSEAWKETSEPGPLNVYGASKLAGEQALLATGASSVVLRTSWVYGSRCKNFLLTILRLAREREQLQIVADQYGAPTWSRDLARLVIQLVSQVEAEAAQRHVAAAEVLASQAGIYHACAGGTTTWFGFAEEILRLAQGSQPDQRFATLRPVTSAEYPTPARRPLNSRLDCEKLERTFGYAFPHWKKSTKAVVDAVLSHPETLTE